MYGLSPSRVRRVGGRLLHMMMSRAVILLYHRIMDISLDPQLLCVSPSNFEEHLLVIRKNYTPISLADLVNHVVDNSVPKRAVAITFDDGYADNLLFAKSRLSEASVPATVFVTTSYIGTNREFWWDELERLLLLPDIALPPLQLCVSGQIYFWPVQTADERRAAYSNIHRLIRPLPANEIEDIVRQMRNWAGDIGRARISHRPLTLEELDQLARDGLIEIGAHTRSHVSLALQPINAQRDEIVGSKLDLERWLNKPVHSFSYPYGCRNDDYNRATLSLVREAGFGRTVANNQDCVTRMSDVHQLPRCLVRNWDGDEFARRLKSFFAF